MKRFLLFTFLLSYCAFASLGQTFVVPPAYASTNGNSSFTGPLANNARRYQMLIHQSLLTSLVGQELTGLGFRVSSTAWPTATTTYTDYSIYLGVSVDPANRSLTDFANNVVGSLTLVRSGSLVFNIGDFSGGATPNNFGPVITFNSNYIYTGGNLLVEIRHSASDGTSKAQDAVSGAGNGFGTDFSSCWATGLTTTTATNGNFIPIQLSYQQPLDVKLSNFSAAWKNNVGQLQWTTVSEKDVSHFAIERSFDGKDFTEIAQVKAAGNSSSNLQYSYNDKTDGLQQMSKIYYRIKMQDLDGSYTYSRVALVTPAMTDAIGTATIYPNPVRNKLNVLVKLLTDEDVNYQILNMQGQTVLSNNYKYVAGSGNMEIDIEQLPAGNYMILLKGNSLNQMLQFSKQ